MQEFRNLSVWQRARRLTKSVYELTVDFPVSEQFGLKNRFSTLSFKSSACSAGC
jgi:hypothetical protein